MSTLFASFITVTMPLTGGSSLFVDNHATTSAPSPSSLILRHQLYRLPYYPPPLPRHPRRRLSSLWLFPSSARHRHHPQDPALSLQISSLFLSSTIQPPLFAVRLLSLVDEDVAAASLLSSSFLHRLAIAASLLSGSFLSRLAIAAIPKIQRCRCRSPSSFPPPSSHHFLPSASSPSPTRMSLPPLFSLVLSFVGSPSLPLFSLVLSFVGSPSPPSPRSSTAIANLLPLPLLHHLAAASCSSLAMPLLHCPPSPSPSPSPLTSTPLLPPPFAIAASQSSVPIRFTSEPDGLTGSRVNRMG